MINSRVHCMVPGRRSSGPAAPRRPGARLGSLALTVLLAVQPLPLAAAEAVAPAPKAETPPPAANTPPGDARAPVCDAGCVRANAERAAQACAPRIENEAPFDFEWLTRPFGGIFQEADPPAPSEAAIRYKGDSIRFMSPQREWVRITYECVFDTAAQRIETVRVRFGRLNGRMAPPPPGPGGQSAAVSGPPAPVASPPPVAPPRKAQRPGEPNSIEILQVNPAQKR